MNDASSKGAQRRWPREAILLSLDRWHQRNLCAPAAHEWWRAGDDHPSSWTVRKVFGNWNNALAAAGLRVRRRGEARSRPRRARCQSTGRFVRSD